MYKGYSKPSPVDISMFDRSIDHVPTLFPTAKDDFNYRKKFYDSAEWKELRKQMLDSSKQFCVNCKRINLQMFVDHILPIKHYWSKRLDKDNLQLLCGLCNAEKENSLGKKWKDKALKKIALINKLGLPKTTVKFDLKEYVDRISKQESYDILIKKLNDLDQKISNTKILVLQKKCKRGVLSNLIHQKDSTIRQLEFLRSKGAKSNIKSALGNSQKIIVISPSTKV